MNDEAYHRKVRSLLIEKYSNIEHYCTENKKAHPYSDCMRLDDDYLDMWDIKLEHDEGYSYSEYTYDSAHSELNAYIALMCWPGLAVLGMAMDQDCEELFYEIVRKLVS